MNVVILDTFTITAAVALLLWGVIAAFFSPFFRYRKSADLPVETADDERTALPPLSIVLTPFDDIDGLRQHLPLLLQQDYPSPFQLIIVLEQGDHDGEAVIAHYEHEHKKQHPESQASVYVTYIPRSSRYVSRKKLAITLGLKAVKTSWVVLTESYCVPATPQWLSAMASRITPDSHLIVGYGNYTDEVPGSWRFERLYRSYYTMREIEKTIGYRDIAHNLLFRKEDFMKYDGFLENLDLVRGEYDFIVNKLATLGGVSLVTDETAWLLEEGATPKRHLNDQLFYLESRKVLERGRAHRAWFNLDQWALHLTLLLTLAGIVYSAVFQNIILLVVAILTLIAHVSIRMVWAKQALTRFREDLSPFTAVWYELGQIWRSLRYLYRYRRADRLDFTTHKL